MRFLQLLSSSFRSLVGRWPHQGCSGFLRFVLPFQRVFPALVLAVGRVLPPLVQRVTPPYLFTLLLCFVFFFNKSTQGPAFSILSIHHSTSVVWLCPSGQRVYVLCGVEPLPSGSLRRVRRQLGAGLSLKILLASRILEGGSPSGGPGALAIGFRQEPALRIERNRDLFSQCIYGHSLFPELWLSPCLPSKRNYSDVRVLAGVF